MKLMPFELLLAGSFRTQVLNPDMRGKEENTNRSFSNVHSFFYEIS